MEKLLYKNARSITIKDKPIISLILRSYADDDQKKILNAVSNKPKIILDIIDTCKLPQTSSYRKINSLVKNGLLIPFSQITRKQGKKVTKYISLFENLEINIVKNDISIKTKINEDAYHAIFSMMREKIVNFRGKQSMLNSKNYQVIQTKTISMFTDSMIPFLLKEGVIKV